MTPFHVVSSEPALLSEGLADQPPKHLEDGLLFKIWTVSSDKQVKALNLTLPGVVFIDYDAKLGSSAFPTTTPETSAIVSESVASQQADAQGVESSRVVAEVIVVSDSVDLLESMELVPLDEDKEDQGFKFRVKNQNAELKGSIVTNIYVSDKHVLRDFTCNSADFVLDSAVLVQDDPEADVNLHVHNCASLYLSSNQGLSLRSLTALVHGTGRLQLLAPWISIQSLLVLIVCGPCTMALLSPTISASIIASAVIKDGDIGVYTETLKAEDMFSVVGLSGAIEVVGSGAVQRQTTGIATAGDVNTGGIVSERTTAHFGWSGRALVQAVEQLDVKSLIFGTAEYTNAKPEVITESSWLWWRKNKTPSEIAKPATVDSTKHHAKSYEFRDPPLRRLMPVHYYVNRGKFYMDKGKNPELVRADKYSWTSRYSTELGVAAGVLAVGTIAMLVKRRRNTRLAQQVLRT